MNMLPGERPLRAFLEPIADILGDPATNEVVINRPGEVGIEQRGKWSWRDCPDFTFERLDQIGILAAYQTGRELDGDHPLANSTLPDGQRIHICRPPATLPGVTAMCIRKPPKEARKLREPDLADLFSEANTGPARRSAADAGLVDLYRARYWLAFLEGAVAARKTIGATGLTGSGKSDFLRRLLGAAPETDRVITIESDPEFGPVGPRNRVNLFYNDDRPGQRAIDVVNTSLRMYPKTLAFQGVRGPEAFPLMRAIISGHNSFTSWHAEDGDEVGAMAMMLRQHPACQTTPPEQLEALTRRCFDIIISFDRYGEAFRVRRVWFRSAEELQNA
jgi:type IV secretion system protein VirB11